jgi:hypothetical protein
MVHLSLVQRNKNTTKTARTAVLESLFQYLHFHLAAAKIKDSDIIRIIE